MSDVGAVTAKVTRRLRKKKGKQGAVGRKIKLAFQLSSKKRTQPKGKRKIRTWHDDWPEFLEQLKALAKRYQMTIRKTD